MTPYSQTSISEALYIPSRASHYQWLKHIYIYLSVYSIFIFIFTARQYPTSSYRDVSLIEVPNLDNFLSTFQYLSMSQFLWAQEEIKWFWIRGMILNFDFEFEVFWLLCSGFPMVMYRIFDGYVQIFRKLCSCLPMGTCLLGCQWGEDEDFHSYLRRLRTKGET